MAHGLRSARPSCWLYVQLVDVAAAVVWLQRNVSFPPAILVTVFLVVGAKVPRGPSRVSLLALPAVLHCQRRSRLRSSRGTTHYLDITSPKQPPNGKILKHKKKHRAVGCILFCWSDVAKADMVKL